ncbi:hypothetical protein EW026_g871 [Hermanssonia centrifuga]|uniref:T6SS Phospholipase effector Tle1-like catalytic domain-containing protein n=1 Tax=Hermanssonia centrifuga TaxID=98765 RepID=A0A4S4KTG9_9APHY|nr:hypothetical protein EW026_g871 [Hermanssonia centrifuga]
MDIASSSSPSTPPVPGPSVVPKMSTDSGMLKSRTLILCFDGTANQYDGDNTNVVKFYSLLQKDATEEQMCYYQPGVGTYLQPGVVSPLFQWCAKIADEAVAWYLDAHVRGGYQFLMQNYRPGDKIWFSRGAYTARALAVITQIGLLPKDNPEQVPLAYKMYKSTGDQNVSLAAGFKQTFCRDVKIEFVGVWETVASVGVLMGKTLPFTTANTTIKTFRHALALDEHRAKFRPNLYHRPPPKTQPAPVPAVKPPASPVVASPVSMTSNLSASSTSKFDANKSAPKSNDFEKAGKRLPFSQRMRAGRKKFHGPMDQFMKHDDEKSAAPQETMDPADDPADDYVQTDVLERSLMSPVLLPLYTDVGGGSVTNSTTHCLSDISLRWMVREVVMSQCGIQFNSDALILAGITDSVFSGIGFALASPGDGDRKCKPPTPLHVHTTTPNAKELEAQAEARANEHEEDIASESIDSDEVDAIQPIHDELQLNKWWWLLEILPTCYSWQDGKGKIHRKWESVCYHIYLDFPHSS